MNKIDVISKYLPKDVAELVLKICGPLLQCKDCLAMYQYDTPGYPKNVCPLYCRGCSSHTGIHDSDCTYCRYCNRSDGIHQLACNMFDIIM